MTVPSTARRAGPFLGNGVTTTFSFSFKTFAAGDLAVTRMDALGLETTLVLNSDYSVSLNADQDASPGGTITYPLSGSPLAAGQKLTIVGDLDYEQTTDLLGGGAFNARVIEDTFDRTVIQIQQLEERLDRALVAPVNSTANVQLPNPEANELIGWDSTGSNLANYSLSQLATGIAYGTMRFDTFTGNGTTTQFALTEDPAALANLDVSISGVTQIPGTDYTLTSATIVFTSAPPNGAAILARYGRALPVSGPIDSSAVTFLQAGANAQPRTAQGKMRDVVNVKDFGAAPGNSNASNKLALQAAITYVNSAGGGQIVVDYDINYGVKTRTPSTWPDFTGVTKPIIVLDYSTGDTQAPDVYPTRYDGAMYRVWTFTPQTTSPGQHDGNTQWLRAAWAPAYCMSNDANLAAVGHPSRNAFDNRRAYYATMVDGEANWQWGNGTLAGAALTDEELSNFVIEKFAMAGDTLGNYTPYLVERKTGNVSYGAGRNIPAAHHHFEAVTGSPTLDLMMFQSKGTTCSVVLRNSNGSGDDVYVRNIAGAISFDNVNGPVLELSKANRYVGIGVTGAAYRFDVAESKSGDYVVRERNTNATNGYIVNWTSASVAGTGWTFLDAWSSGGSDREFALRGDGTGLCDGSWTGGGADYAEYFEWADGNPDNEDRRGFSVSLIGGKIQKAVAGDVVIGVISGNPSVVGDSAWNRWSGKYLRDDFNGYIMEPCQVVEWDERIKVSDAVPAVPAQTITRYVKQDDGSFAEVHFHDPGRDEQPERWEVKRHSYMTDAVPAGLVVPADAEYRSSERRKINPNYKEGADYTPRSERPEWDCVGLMGKLRVRKGQPVDARWIKMRDISETVEEWLVR